MSASIPSQTDTPAEPNSSVFLIQQPIDTSSLNAQDTQFIAQASSANQIELAEARLALSHSDAAAVQLFGQWMITDHVAFGAALNGIASQLGVTTTATPNTQEIDSLRSAYGTSFDQLYTQDQVNDHQQTLALFQQEVANGQNPTLKSLAQQALLILQQHLTGAEQLAGTIGGSQSATDTGGSTDTSGSDQPQQTTASPPSSDTSQTPAAPAGTPSAQDISFAQFAAQSGLTEVQEGQLAASDSSDPAVAVFGQWMVTDHTAVNSVLQNLAQQEGITLPTAPSQEQQSEIAQLQSLSPDASASAYSGAQVTDHAATLIQFIKEATTGQDPAIKTFAQDSIPLLTEHLVGAIDLQLDQLGIGQLALPVVNELIGQAYGAGLAAGTNTSGTMVASDGSGTQCSGSYGLIDPSQAHALMTVVSGSASS